MMEPSRAVCPLASNSSTRSVRPRRSDPCCSQVSRTVVEDMASNTRVEPPWRARPPIKHLVRDHQESGCLGRASGCLATAIADRGIAEVAVRASPATNLPAATPGVNCPLSTENISP